MGKLYACGCFDRKASFTPRIVDVLTEVNSCDSGLLDQIVQAIFLDAIPTEVIKECRRWRVIVLFLTFINGLASVNICLVYGAYSNLRFQPQFSYLGLCTLLILRLDFIRCLLNSLPTTPFN